MTSKIFLVKINQHKDFFVDLFGDIVENVYLEFYAFSHHTREGTERNLKHKFSEISSYNNIIDIDLGNTIVIEFKKESLVYFNGNTSGASVGKYMDGHEKVDALPERIEF